MHGTMFINNYRTLSSSTAKKTTPINNNNNNHHHLKKNSGTTIINNHHHHHYSQHLTTTLTAIITITIRRTINIVCFLICLKLTFVLCQNLICQRIPNLTVQQQRICQQTPEILSVIRKGISLALVECRHLFQNQERIHPAWNCSWWIQNSLNRLFVNITDREITGTKEASFAHAIFSAGVVFTLSEACTKGNFPYCSCGGGETSLEPNNNNNNNNENPRKKALLLSNKNFEFVDRSVAINQEWKQNGCSHNIKYATEMARLFLDSVEHRKLSPYSLLNIHNNNVGRKIIKDSVTLRCQCHGISGSCTFQTCWHSIGVFPQATRRLYERYDDAKLVSYAWLIKTFRQKFERRPQRKNDRDTTVNRLNQLHLLQQSMTNITLFELNQPNPNRVKHHHQFHHRNQSQSKANKQDLIYVKPSVNYCHRLSMRSLPVDYLNATSNVHNLNDTHSTLWPCSMVNKTEKQIFEQIQSKNRDSIRRSMSILESCDRLCCGRGFRPKTYLATKKCDCVFQFCCMVSCKICTTMITEYECL